jgi:hypothetical protein
MGNSVCSSQLQGQDQAVGKLGQNSKAAIQVIHGRKDTVMTTFRIQELEACGFEWDIRAAAGKTVC